MDVTIIFFKDQVLLENKDEANKLKKRAAKFVLHVDILYKKGISSPLIWYTGREEEIYVRREIHEGVCGPILKDHHSYTNYLGKGY